MSGTDTWLEVREARQEYGGFSLQIAHLAIPRGSAVALLGPTGAGKSTLLRLLAGLEAPVEGQVSLENRPLTTDDTSLAARRRMAFVFQSPRLLSRTVRDNLSYGLRVRRRGRHDLAIVDKLLTRLGLAQLEHQAARTLSGGQSQLVALGRALAIEPEILLLDEPTANLDPARVALVERIVEEARRHTGVTVIWATHNLFQARRVSDRVAFLLNGRLIEENATAAFFEQPADPRSRDFIEGRMIY